MLVQKAVPQIVLSIEADLCGPMSIGTVAVIRAIAKHLGLSLAQANEFVDRCVFEGQKITLPAATRAQAEALLAEFAQLPAAPRIHASIAD
jgi:hypothetical protein